MAIFADYVKTIALKRGIWGTPCQKP